MVVRYLLYCTLPRREDEFPVAVITYVGVPSLSKVDLAYLAYLSCVRTTREGASPKPDESRREGGRQRHSIQCTHRVPMYPSKYRHHPHQWSFSHHITVKALIATQPVAPHIMITSGPYDRSDLPTWAMSCACSSAIGTDQRRRLAGGAHEPPPSRKCYGLDPAFCFGATAPNGATRCYW